MCCELLGFTTRTRTGIPDEADILRTLVMYEQCKRMDCEGRKRILGCRVLQGHKAEKLGLVRLPRVLLPACAECLDCDVFCIFQFDPCWIAVHCWSQLRNSQEM